MFGVSVCTVDGNTFSFGDDAYFTLQGLSWIVAHALALEEHGEAKVSNFVGNEGSPAPPFAFVLNTSIFILFYF